MLKDFSIKMDKKLYIQCIKEFNYPGSGKTAVKNAYIKFAIRSVIILMSVAFVIGIFHGLSFMLINATPDIKAGDHDELLATATFVGFFVAPILFVANSVHAFFDFKRGRQIRKRIDRFVSNQHLPKNLFSIIGENLTICPIRIKGTKLVLEEKTYPLYLVRDIIPYHRYGVQNTAIIATTKDLVPIVIRNQADFDTIKEILN